ncbi:hypothetical protein VitviT2T_029068 [Vitis vinifera]|uniref:TIR domain-containing protein n=3 Tax=Vitis vinifera TaxID=29760 RepID=A0ABY9DV23_VITVI|nr:hypothetical protein VitviT2T_029068 [Vitis vinifera]
MALASPSFILLVSIVNLSTLWRSSCHNFIWTKPMIQEEAKIKLGVDYKCAPKDEVMAAAAASSSQRCSDVFLSFRGEDTRNNFTAYLDQELRTQRIDCFIDEEKIERDKAISPALVAATENSMFSIIVLSEDYAHLPGGAWRS